MKKVHRYSPDARALRAQLAARRRDAADVERVLEFLREPREEKDGAALWSAEGLREALADRGHRFSGYKLRALLRYLVLRRDAAAVRNAVPGRRTVLFRAAPRS